MKLTARLAYSQLKNNKRRTLWSLFGIVLSMGMIVAIGGTAYTLYRMVTRGFGRLIEEGSITADLTTEQLIGFYAVAGVFAAIIVLIGAIVMSNAFAMSASERIKQFGILKSVGATKKQIISTVRYEALWLSIIGIPVGLAFGLLLQMIITMVINHAMINVNTANGFEQHAEYIISIPVVAISAAIGFLTIIISAGIPAGKAARLPAMTAIRGGASGVVSHVKRMKSSPLLARCFGAEGLLAAKYMRHNKKRYTAVIRALTISTILLIAGGAFAENIHSSFSLAFRDIPYNAAVTIGKNLYDPESSVDVSTARVEEISSELSKYEHAQSAFVKYNRNYTTSLKSDNFTSDYRKYVSEENGVKASLIAFDRATYEKILKLANADYGEAVVLNRWSVKNGNNATVFTPFELDGDTISILPDSEPGGQINGGSSGQINGRSSGQINGTTDEQINDESGEQIKIGGELKEFPVELSVCLSSDVLLNIIVPDCEATQAVWLADADDLTELSEFYTKNLESENVILFNLEADKNASDSVQMMFNAVLFIFVGAVVLIGFSGVISTIATQSAVREKEFAVLRSVGETDAGIRKMFAIESVIFSAKSLLYGSIIGIPFAYFAITSSVNAMMVVQTERLMPYGSIAAAIGIVAAIAFCATLYSVRLSRTANILEAIRRDGV